MAVRKDEVLSERSSQEIGDLLKLEEYMDREIKSRVKSGDPLEFYPPELREKTGVELTLRLRLLLVERYRKHGWSVEYSTAQTDNYIRLS